MRCPLALHFGYARHVLVGRLDGMARMAEDCAVFECRLAA
jgi:hypothetical protein